MADRLLEYVADGKGFLIITNYPKLWLCIEYPFVLPTDDPQSIVIPISKSCLTIPFFSLILILYIRSAKPDETIAEFEIPGIGQRE